MFSDICIITGNYKCNEKLSIRKHFFFNCHLTKNQNIQKLSYQTKHNVFSSKKKYDLYVLDIQGRPNHGYLSFDDAVFKAAKLNSCQGQNSHCRVFIKFALQIKILINGILFVWIKCLVYFFSQ